MSYVLFIVGIAVGVLLTLTVGKKQFVRAVQRAGERVEVEVRQDYLAKAKAAGLPADDSWTNAMIFTALRRQAEPRP